MITPTPRLWLLVAAGIPLALAGLAVPGLERWVIVWNLFLAALVGATTWMTRRWPQLQISRETDPILSARAWNDVRLNVINPLPFDITVRLRDEEPMEMQADGNEQLIRLQAYREHDVTYRLRPRVRGRFSFPGVWVQFDAPLGLVRISQSIPLSGEARVTANIKAIEDFELLNQRGHLKQLGQRRSRSKGLGTEFESLRDYNEDDYRRIDWKASARRGKLVVRNYEHETNQSVFLLVDVGRHMLGDVAETTKLEHCLDTAVLLMHAVERAGDQIGLLMFNDVVRRYVPPKRGRHQLGRIAEAFFDVQAEPTQPDYPGAFAYLSTRWKRRSLVVVFTDAEDLEQANELAAALGPLSRRHLVYVVRVADPRIREMEATPIEDMNSLATRSAAVWYRADRLRAEQRLGQFGIAGIEAEPEELAARLVGAYLRVKERNLI